MRQMDLATMVTNPRRATFGTFEIIGLDAKTQSSFEVLEHLVRLGYPIFFTAQPKRYCLGLAAIFSKCHEFLKTSVCDLVVRQMYLLDPRLTLAESPKALCPLVVNLVFVKLQNPEIWTSTTDLQNRLKPIRRQSVIREVYLVVVTSLVLRLRKIIYIFIFEALTAVIQNFFPHDGKLTQNFFVWSTAAAGLVCSSHQSIARRS